MQCKKRACKFAFGKNTSPAQSSAMSCSLFPGGVQFRCFARLLVMTGHGCFVYTQGLYMEEEVNGPAIISLTGKNTNSTPKIRWISMNHKVLACCCCDTTAAPCVASGGRRRSSKAPSGLWSPQPPSQQQAFWETSKTCSVYVLDIFNNYTIIPSKKKQASVLIR